MAARKKTSKSKSVKTTKSASSFFNKDLFMFILIMGIVAVITYVLTYNALTAKFSQQLGDNTPSMQAPH